VQRDIEHLLQQDPLIDTIILGCTHFPLLLKKVRAYTPARVKLIPQGEFVAASLQDYLHRHPEMESRLTRGATARFLTTDDPAKFASAATIFMGQAVEADRVTLS